MACFNENSLLDYWQDALGTRLDELPAYFRDELRGLWNEWLRAKYGDDTALSAAWFGKPAFPPGRPDLVRKPGETLEAGTIPLPSGAERQRPDWIDFLAETERGWIDRMRSLVKDELGCRALFIGTQVEYGGTTGYRREELSDIADSHMYWDLMDGMDGGPFSFRNWRLTKNASQIQAFTERNFEVLGWLAEHRQAGKPFTVSESDYAAVNDYHSESVLLLASFAAYQDWDAVCGFDLEASGAYEAADMITDLYDQCHNPSVWSFYPLAALIFRQGLIPEAKSRVVLSLAAEPWKRFEYVERAWEKLMPAGAMGFLSRAFSVDVATGGRPVTKDAVTRNEKDKSSPLALRDLARGRAYVADSETALFAAGFLGGSTLKTRYLEIETGRFGNDHASLGMVSLDGKPLDSSARTSSASPGAPRIRGSPGTRSGAASAPTGDMAPRSRSGFP